MHLFSWRGNSKKLAQADYACDVTRDLSAEIEEALNNRAEDSADYEGGAALDPSVVPAPSPLQAPPPAVRDFDTPAGARQRTSADVVSLMQPLGLKGLKCTASVLASHTSHEPQYPQTLYCVIFYTMYVELHRRALTPTHLSQMAQLQALSDQPSESPAADTTDQYDYASGGTDGAPGAAASAQHWDEAPAAEVVPDFADQASARLRSWAASPESSHTSR